MVRSFLLLLQIYIFIYLLYAFISPYIF